MLIWLGVGVAGYSLGVIFSPKAPQAPIPPSAPVVSSAPANQPPIKQSAPIPIKPSVDDAASAAKAGSVESLQDIFRYPSRIHRCGALKAWADTVPVDKLPEILRQILKLPSDERSDVVRMFFVSWSERDPRAGTRFLNELRGIPGFANLPSQFYKAWSGRDPAGSRAWVETNLRGAERLFAQRAMLKRPETLEGILAIEDANLRQAYLLDHFSTPGRLSREEALAQAGKLEDGMARYNSVRRLLHSWAEVDPVAAVSWFTSRPPEEREMQGYSIFRPILQKNPSYALRLAEQMPVGSTQLAMLSQVAAQMVADDLPQALLAVEKIQKLYPDTMASEFYAAWVEKDPATAIPKLKEEIWRLNGKTKEGFSTGFSNAIDSWARRDPVAVSKFITEMPPETHDELFWRLSNSWVSKDPNEAVSWANQLPEGRMKESAVQQLAGQWGKYEFEESSRWIRTLSDGATRAAAVKGFAMQSFDNDPDAVLSLIRSVADENRRAEILKATWDRWSYKNHDTAQKWLKDTQLSDMERKLFPP